jgi:hypothetical protein
VAPVINEAAGGQEDNCARHLDRLTDPAERDVCKDVLLEVRAGKRGARSVGLDEGRGDGVDGDVVGAPLDRETARKVVYRRLRHAVDRFARERDHAGLRAHIDDAAEAPLDHQPADGLAGEEGALEVDADHVVEVGLRHVLCRAFRTHAGVVDEHVNLAEVPVRLADRASDLVELLHVHLQGQGATAHRFDLACERLAALLAPKAERHVGPRMRESERASATEPARRGGDESHLAAEIKTWKGFSHGGVSQGPVVFRIIHIGPQTGAIPECGGSKFLAELLSDLRGPATRQGNHRCSQANSTRLR